MKLTATHGETCLVQFSAEQLTEIFKLQSGANDVMSDAWRTSTNTDIPYYRASWLEFAEALTHIGFKWWKMEHKTDESFNNAVEQSILEIVDVMHFAASDYIRTDAILPTSVEYPGVASISAEGVFSNSGNWESMDIREVIEQAVADIILRKTVSWSWIAVLAETFGVTSDKLYGMYVGKNVLNLFRTANGQREGTYNKLWNGIEDNVFLTEYMQEAETNETGFTADELFTYLTDTYNDYQKQGKTQAA